MLLTVSRPKNLSTASFLKDTLSFQLAIAIVRRQNGRAIIAYAPYSWRFSLGSGATNHVTTVGKRVENYQINVSPQSSWKGDFRWYGWLTAFSQRRTSLRYHPASSIII
jgi:hypothetical protein